jgi:hypothetical protein
MRIRVHRSRFFRSHNGGNVRYVPNSIQNLTHMTTFRFDCCVSLVGEGAKSSIRQHIPTI